MRLEKIGILLSCLFVGLGLNGCATNPSDLGIAPDQWEQMTPNQKENILMEYDKIHRDHTNGFTTSRPSKTSKDRLLIHISHGKAAMPPTMKSVAFKPVSFEIKGGECGKEIPVYQADDDHIATWLTACYRDDVLYLDPSHYEFDKRIGSLQFPEMPLWKRGFTYPNMSSSGVVHFSNVDIKLQQLASGNDS